MTAYRARVATLAAALRPASAPACVKALPRGAGVGAGGAPVPPARPAVPPPPPGAARPPQPHDTDAQRGELLAGARAAPTLPPPALRSVPPASLAVVTAGTRTAVERERALQDTLTDDLVGLAARLRSNAEGAAAAVARRGSLLDAAEATVENARGAAGRSVAEAKAVYATNRRGFWATCAAFLVVGGVFTATFVFIRATALFGYSKRKVAAAAARRAAKRAADMGTVVKGVEVVGEGGHTDEL